MTSEPDRKELAQTLIDCDAVLHGEFTLSSGKTSNYYIDKYVFETDPVALEKVAEAVAEKAAGIDASKLAGVALGAVPLTAAASVESSLPYVIARKSAKDYGTSNAIEGDLSEGEEVVVVEDIVTMGSSAVEAIEKLRNAGAEVNHIIVVVDRQEGGVENIQDKDVEVHPLLTAEDLV